MSNDPLCLDSAKQYPIGDNIDILLAENPGFEFAKLKLVWYEHPYERPGMRATCDRWFIGRTPEDLKLNIDRHIKQYGIIEAHEYKPKENTHESDTPISESSQ